MKGFVEVEVHLHLLLALALDGGQRSGLDPTALLLGKVTPVLLDKEVGWVPEPILTHWRREIYLAPAGNSTHDLSDIHSVVWPLGRLGNPELEVHNNKNCFKMTVRLLCFNLRDSRQYSLIHMYFLQANCYDPYQMKLPGCRHKNCRGTAQTVTKPAT